MVRAASLRIGNYIKQGKVRSVYYDGKVGLDDGHAHIPELLNYIPLTPAILEELADTEGSMFYYLGKLAIHKVTGVVYWNSWKILEKIDYYHQLQNLYFILTNNELQCKPTTP